MPSTPHRRTLSPPLRAVLGAAARCIVPHAAEVGVSAADLVARIEERLATAPPERVRDLELALTVLGSRSAALLFSGIGTPFVRLAPDEQDLLLARWGASRFGVARSIHQGIRRLVLAVYYSLPESHAEIGYLGPFHLRPPALPWEGALPDGAPNEQEPVARGASPGATANPRETHVGAASASTPLDHGSLASAPPHAGAPALSNRLAADVIVIGSGAGGAVAAARLAEAGRDVLILEEGSLLRGDALTEREGDMTARLYAEGGMRATDDLGVILLQGAAVGGGTLVNWMITFRAPDHVLEEWRHRFGLEGFSPPEMAPVFERVEREIHATCVPDDAHSPNNRILLDGARALGWRASSARINARGCLRTGFCGMGCRYGAKQSADAVYLPRALAAGARLVSDARAERIEIVERDIASSAAARGARRIAAPLKRVHVALLDPVTRAPRGELVAEAPVVVVAGGAIGTPVLLQRSGLGGGAVGSYLRLHPTSAVVGLHDREVYAAAGIPQSAVCDEFSRRDANGYGFWIECAPHHPALGAVAAPGFGAPHRELMRHFRRTANMIVLVRDGADLEMSNGSVRLSRRGRPRISYALGPRDRAHLIAGLEAAARIQLAAGASEVRTLHTAPFVIRNEQDAARIRTLRFAPNDLTIFSAHVNGSCRMGTDRRRSAVAPDGERHGVRGLYVADGSLLPTGLGVNPQATIMAVSTIIAERMVNEERA